MNADELRAHLDRLAATLGEKERTLLSARLKSLVSVFPFNEYEYALMFLLDREVLGFDDYEHLRDNYVSSNRYLELYGLAPRIFGEIWVQEHLRDLDSRFVKPSRLLDPSYEGQYDLWIQGIKVEVKAARAINTKKRGSLVSKALQYASDEPFWMNFQQIKLDACDVFIFVGVWVDEIVYWVLSNVEARENEFLSHQHRGGIEYQIGVTHKNLDTFGKYRAEPSQLGQAVIEAAKRL